VRRTRRPLLVLVLLLVLLAIGYVARTVHSNEHHSSSTHSQTMATVGLSALPIDARHTIALVQAGGPFPYSRDGVVFRNAEGLLPKERSGYYHEYTVPTPGESDRGARRIITGADGEFYYTADHYESFKRVEMDT
jgi:ribonuclease T1